MRLILILIFISSTDISIGQIINSDNSENRVGQVPETQYYSKCERRGISGKIYQLRADSLLLCIEHAEQFRSPVKNVGTWLTENNLIEWNELNLKIKYYQHTIGKLMYLVPSQLDIDSVKNNLIECLNKGDKEELLTFINEPDSTKYQQIEKRFEYLDAHNCTCNNDLLVEVPKDIVKMRKYNFEYKKKRRKSTSRL